MTATHILSELGLRRGTCRAGFILRAYRLSNAEGTIQADAARTLFGDPRKHTTCNLRSVLLRAGCVDAAS